MNKSIFDDTFELATIQYLQIQQNHNSTFCFRFMKSIFVDIIELHQNDTI